MNLKDIKIYYYDITSNESNAITIENLLNALEKSNIYPYKSGMKFFYSKNKRDKAIKKHREYINKLNKN